MVQDYEEKLKRLGEEIAELRETEKIKKMEEENKNLRGKVNTSRETETCSIIKTTQTLREKNFIPLMSNKS